MFSGKIAVRLLIPAATLVAEKSELRCKPSELPIYTPDTPKEPMKIIREPGVLEKQVGNVRKQIMSLTTQITRWQNYAAETYEDGKNQAQWLIKYLQEEDNTTPKAGAIAIGGLAGFILALRRRFFRKLVFTSAGALAMAAVCYPKEAADYANTAKVEIKRYLKIAYNFYHGVKKDDPPLELPSLPKIPTTTSEIWSLVAGTNTKSNNVSDRIDLHHLIEEVPRKTVTVESIEAGIIEPDPHTVVSHFHEKATKKNCHCPVGACLHNDDEGPPS